MRRDQLKCVREPIYSYESSAGPTARYIYIYIHCVIIIVHTIIRTIWWLSASDPCLVKLVHNNYNNSNLANIIGWPTVEGRWVAVLLYTYSELTLWKQHLYYKSIIIIKLAVAEWYSLALTFDIRKVWFLFWTSFYWK